MIFQGLSVARNFLRPETAPSTIMAIKRGFLYFAKKRPLFYGIKQHGFEIFIYY